MSRPYRSQYNFQVMKDLQQAVKHFTPSASATAAVKISDVRSVASYSWLNERTPTILVPGAPPVWTNHNPERAPPDLGWTFIDQNSARMGANRSPLTPIFAALQDLGKLEELRGLDLVTDRSNLRKLLRWATGDPKLRDFRIEVEAAGDTVLFTRVKKKDMSLNNGGQGYGNEYKKAATTQPLGSEKATGHHRITGLSLGGIKVLLCFEVDACIRITNAEDQDGLTGAIAGFTTTAKRFPGVTIRRSASRTIVPQSSTIELRTRVAHRLVDWESIYSQLYLSQTPYLYLAKHKREHFQPAEKHDLAGPELQGYAEQAEAGMVKLQDVLLQILECAKKEGEGMGMSLACQDGSLALYRRKKGTGRAVGKEILAMFKFGKE
ncbi:hypothetical protein FRB94_004265 [Tulasnella sp. JGI-2019a]|nr:hypothetical protein FRB93_000266 [Tulasnella sp. JGI-2019a]KAG9015146.1 hypothetical protein FRB94_004265 [Tulasnella sp. JGI-2019a]KAG9039215.1 hypothetical protein FRB95_011800 [Tulasnella sp. JGI-2019a]